MSKFKNYEKLIGVTAEGDATEIENNTESVAEYICSKGVKGDLYILTPDGERVLNTFGMYVDRCVSPEYMEHLRPVLVQKQHKTESEIVLRM